MERRAEPEVMDDQAQADAYADADFEEVNQAFVERFLALWPDFQRGRILDLGCGPADISIRFSAVLPDVTVCALDASWPMLERGRRAVGERAGIGLVQAYLPDLPLEPAAFDAVVSNSLLHHLADPMDLWRAVQACGRPGAPVLVCDLFRPPSEADARAIVDEADSSESTVLLHDFLSSLLAAYSLDEVREQLALAGLDGFEAELITERHVFVWGRL